MKKSQNDLNVRRHASLSLFLASSPCCCRASPCRVSLSSCLAAPRCRRTVASSSFRVESEVGLWVNWGKVRFRVESDFLVGLGQ